MCENESVLTVLTVNKMYFMCWYVLVCVGICSVIRSCVRDSVCVTCENRLLVVGWKDRDGVCESTCGC